MDGKTPWVVAGFVLTAALVASCASSPAGNVDPPECVESSGHWERYKKIRNLRDAAWLEVESLQRRALAGLSAAEMERLAVLEERADVYGRRLRQASIDSQIAAKRCRPFGMVRIPPHLRVLHGRAAETSEGNLEAARALAAIYGERGSPDYDWAYAQQWRKRAEALEAARRVVQLPGP